MNNKRKSNRLINNSFHFRLNLNLCSLKQVYTCNDGMGKGCGFTVDVFNLPFGDPGEFENVTTCFIKSSNLKNEMKNDPREVE